jgi:hypothetical protein
MVLKHEFKNGGLQRLFAVRKPRRRMWRAKQASPGSFFYLTFSVGESGGKPPHSIKLLAI